MAIVSNCSAPMLKDAALALKQGHLVAFPTETVYGLGADATNKKAVARIYEVKGRPTNHPLIVHISSMELLDFWATKIPEYAKKLAKEFWPGPMTLVLPRTDLAKHFITGGQETVALRVPSHKSALKLLKNFEKLGGFGIAAPSANRFGKLSPTKAEDVFSEIGSRLEPSDIVLDSGYSQVGIESTIIDCTRSLPQVLRPGFITEEMIEHMLSMKLSLGTASNKITRVPGDLFSHYSPDARVYLSNFPKEGDGLIALEAISTPSGVIRLASPKNELEFAQVLYGALRLGDEKKIENIHVVPPIDKGIGRAINNRLSKIAKN